MGLFDRGKSKDKTLAEQAARWGELTQEAALYETQLKELRELVKHLDEDRALLIKAQEILQPGLGPKVLGEALLELCFKPFGLASFYLAMVNEQEDQLNFYAYHEGGRVRNHTPRSFSNDGGLTARVILERAPRYTTSLDESKALGAKFSEAERVSGLIPQSWYGVPLGRGERPFGLVCFQSFQPDAFTESTRRLMDALAGILAMALRAPKD